MKEKILKALNDPGIIASIFQYSHYNGGTSYTFIVDAETFNYTPSTLHLFAGKEEHRIPWNLFEKAYPQYSGQYQSFFILVGDNIALQFSRVEMVKTPINVLGFE